MRNLLREVDTVLKVPAHTGNIVKPPATISEFFGHGLPAEEVEAVLIAQLSHALPLTVATGALRKDKVALAERLLAEEVGQDAFVFGDFHKSASQTSARGADLQ